MPRVRFLRVGLDVEVPLGTSILAAAQEAGAPEGSHCGGVCACSKCHVYVEQGAELLSPMEHDERDMLDLAAEELRESSRLGCQARVVAEGTCAVRISEESFRTYLDKQPDDRQRALALWLRANR
jgi:2Fe-2S ferredoxin